MERYLLGGRAFVHVGESTVEHDLHFLALKSRAGLDSVAMAEGESHEAYAVRLLEELIASGKVLPLLGCLLMPEPAEAWPSGWRESHGEPWTPQMGEATAKFLGSLTEPADEALLNSLITTVLIDFFQSGLVSLKTSATSSDASAGPQAPAPEPAMAVGQS